MVLHVKEIKEEACVNLDFITTLVFLKKNLRNSAELQLFVVIEEPSVNEQSPGLEG